MQSQEPKTANQLKKLIPQRYHKHFANLIDALIQDLLGEDGLYDQNRTDDKVVVTQECMHVFKVAYAKCEFPWVPKSENEWQKLFNNFV